MDIRFKGKIALVTGGGKGIGRAVAKALYDAGAVTYVFSRTNADLETLKHENPHINTVCVDVSNWQATTDATKAIGTIDILVNNAGIGILENFMNIKEGSFDSIMAINVKAVICVSQVVANTMIESGKGGAIVNVSSQASQAALEDHSVYCASKAALDALTRNMALELGKHNIRVNSVLPTVVMTDMGKKAWGDENKAASMKARIPLGRFAEEKNVVHAILYLLSEYSDMITGTSLPVDGGFLV